MQPDASAKRRHDSLHLASDGLPTWLSLSTAGVLSGTAPVVTSSTPFNFSVTVTDAAGAVSASQSLSVTVNPGILITTASPLPGTDSGLSYSQTLASSGGTGTVTWSSTNLPSWLRLSSDGHSEWDSTLGDDGHTVQLQCDRHRHCPAHRQQGIQHHRESLADHYDRLAVARVGRPYTQTIAVSGGTAPLTFADNGTTLPAWLTVTSGGILSGTPTATGPVSFTLRVIDTLSSSATKTFSLAINAAPSVTTTSLPAASSGDAYSQTLAEAGGTSPFTWQATGLPTWLNLSNAGCCLGRLRL
ncbi:MAG: Ig domain-containing protein [Ignavibacteriota bacterium]